MLARNSLKKIKCVPEEEMLRQLWLTCATVNRVYVCLLWMSHPPLPARYSLKTSACVFPRGAEATVGVAGVMGDAVVDGRVGGGGAREGRNDGAAIRGDEARVCRNCNAPYFLASTGFGQRYYIPNVL
jgi:hypothetical protein